MVEFKFYIGDDDSARASQGALALADLIREMDGVESVERHKADPSSMDLGSIVAAVAASGATLAIAQGLAAWLMARRNATIIIEATDTDVSLKAQVAGIDPRAAERITERILKAYQKRPGIGEKSPS